MKRSILAVLSAASLVCACADDASGPPPATPVPPIPASALVDAGAPATADTAAAAPSAAPVPTAAAAPDAPPAAGSSDVAAPSGHKPPPAPPDVAAPPANAQKTASGLAYRLLRPSTDPHAKHPRRMSVVTVHYTGWTTDGKMFDSSLTEGTPAEFPLDKVIPGWTEGVQLMKVGDVMRFWIPGNLAYDDPSRPAREGVPHGMLVFDVELLGVK